MGAGSWLAATRIEADLEGGARAALDDAGISATVRFDGRDAVLTGEVPGPQEADRAVILVADLSGTRTVSSQLRVGTGDGASSTPRPAPSPSSTSGSTGTPRPSPAAAATAAPPKKSPVKPAVPAPAAPTGRIVFGSGGASISGASDTYLRAVAEYLGRNPGITIRIEGHSDNIGARALNQELSTRRADAVARRLVTLGVDAARLHARGFADTRPVASNRTSPGRAANRRVEIVFEGVN